MTARPQATSKPIEENERVTITEWRIPPGGETGWHRHAFDYVIVYRTAARLSMESKEGTESVELPEGKSFFRAAGVEHNVVNAGERDAVFVEVEIR
jgi:quercetin dioxygenase-like cupin family protein